MLPNEEILLRGNHGENIPLNIGKYPNGEPYVKFDLNRLSFCMNPALIVRTGKFETLQLALFIADAMASRGMEITSLYVPHVPGSRQDKMNNEEGADVLFSGKSIAFEIQSRGFQNIHILDPHSIVTPALLGHVEVHGAGQIFRYMQTYLPIHDYTGVIAPDAGAAKRAEEVAKVLNVPVFQAWKTRSPQDGKITGFGSEEIPVDAQPHLLVVDDLCDGGGTFSGLGKHLEERYGLDQQLDLYVTHGFFTNGVQPLLNWYDHIYTTDSIRPQFNTSLPNVTCVDYVSFITNLQTKA